MQSPTHVSETSHLQVRDLCVFFVSEFLLLVYSKVLVANWNNADLGTELRGENGISKDAQLVS